MLELAPRAYLISPDAQLAHCLAHTVALQNFMGVGLQAYLVHMQVTLEGKVAAIEAKFKEMRESGGSGFNREILEYKSIQGVHKLENSKGYRTWNEKFKNAM